MKKDDIIFIDFQIILILINLDGPISYRWWKITNNYLSGLYDCLNLHVILEQETPLGELYISI